MDSGFGSLSAFNKSFRKLAGMSPSDFRRVAGGRQPGGRNRCLGRKRAAFIEDESSFGRIWKVWPVLKSSSSYHFVVKASGGNRPTL